jgi:hypothetical protein
VALLKRTPLGAVTTRIADYRARYALRAVDSAERAAERDATGEIQWRERVFGPFDRWTPYVVVEKDGALFFVAAGEHRRDPIREV